jgi:hypothetical protein
MASCGDYWPQRLTQERDDGDETNPSCSCVDEERRDGGRSRRNFAETMTKFGPQLHASI